MEEFDGGTSLRNHLKFDLNEAIEILERTPKVLNSLLGGLSDVWTHQNEGEDTWSPFDVLGHLIHGENTDWLVRIRLILSEFDETFEPFDRFAQFQNSKGKSMSHMLRAFEELRIINLAELKSFNITEEQLKEKIQQE